MEQALCNAEEDEDVVAVKTVEAEQQAELVEFDENVSITYHNLYVKSGCLGAVGR